MDAITEEDDPTMLAMVAREYGALADLLEGAPDEVWDAPSLCAGWRTREVVAHMTMPARYDGPAFMAALEEAGGDFTAVSNTIATREGGLPVHALIADLRSPTLHEWQPPGGDVGDALTHCVIHELDITESVPLDRRVPAECMTQVLRIVAAPDTALFGVDLSGVTLRADDLDWSVGAGPLVSGPAQALALVACGRLLPAGRLHGDRAPRFSRTR